MYLKAQLKVQKSVPRTFLFSFKVHGNGKIVISKRGVLGNLGDFSFLGVVRSQGVAKALPRRCQGVAKALPRRCQGVAKALPRRCQGVAKALPRRFQGVSKAFPRRFQGVAKALLRRC